MTTDDRGRFRVEDLDPRRRLWLVATAKEVLLRPMPLGLLHPNIRTHRNVVVEAVREVRVTLQVLAAESGLLLRVDDEDLHDLVNGSLTLTLSSGSHTCFFTDQTGRKVATKRIWIEPHEPTCHRVIRIGAAAAPSK